MQTEPLTFLPSHLPSPTKRSLSLLFLLQNILDLFSLLDLSQECAKRHLSSLALPQELKEHLLLSIEDPSPQFESILTKLCFYFDILLQASKLEGISVLHELQEIRLFIIKVRSCVISARSSIATTSIFECANTHLPSFYQTAKKLFFSLLPFLEEVKTDENILLYLLEHKNTFNQQLGDKTIESLFHRFFPLGRAYFEAVIYEGLSRRGFESFFMKKAHLIDQLAWEELCPCHPN